MKHIIKYTNLIIPSKMRMETRITVDERSSEFNSTFEGTKSTSIGIFPIISLSIVRPSTVDENGNKVRAPWNVNDSIGMTKFTMPIFASELEGIKNDMKIPELYTYQGKRLELNEDIASKIRRVFMVGNTTLELSAVVIAQEDDSRVEGIKIKFNNEQSSVALTLNEMESLLFVLQHTDVDSISLFMYLNYAGKGDSIQDSIPKPLVDIEPLINH